MKTISRRHFLRHMPLCLVVVIVVAALLLAATPRTATAQDFESAADAVANMKIGWNLGNTLDSNSGDTTNMWIEWWTQGTPTDYETAWGQPVATPELIEMFRDAGFGAIRVPVTWYPHIYPDGAVDEEWMKRVHEVVDYVIDAGLYCILNVHHDTGSSNTHWLVASAAVYEKSHERFYNLWTNIATEFKDYGEKLIFEAYNEMLDEYNSWCFASYAGPNSYNEAVATEAYTALNSYGQDFVDAVRATGGNNAYRNLVISTYSGAAGEGTWNSHLTDPLTQLAYPRDTATEHIIYEAHSYPALQTTATATMNSIETAFSAMSTYLMPRTDPTTGKTLSVPVIIGECGTSEGDDYDTHREVMLEVMKDYSRRAKDYGYTCFYWMSLSDGADRSVPQWTKPDLAEAFLQGYYGDDYILGIETLPAEQATATDNGAIYDIQGRQITLPTKGVYIKNGKKYVAR